MDGDNNTIQLNQIYNNNGHGIDLDGSTTNNFITKNNIYSNTSSGIFINSVNAQYNLIATNNIWGLNQNVGVWINDGDNNTIRSNRIHHIFLYAMYIQGTATNNYTINNSFYSNDWIGLYHNSDDADNNNFI